MYLLSKMIKHHNVYQLLSNTVNRLDKSTLIKNVKSTLNKYVNKCDSVEKLGKLMLNGNVSEVNKCDSIDKLEKSTLILYVSEVNKCNSVDKLEKSTLNTNVRDNSKCESLDNLEKSTLNPNVRENSKCDSISYYKSALVNLDLITLSKLVSILLLLSTNVLSSSSDSLDLDSLSNVVNSSFISNLLIMDSSMNFTLLINVIESSMISTLVIMNFLMNSTLFSSVEDYSKTSELLIMESSVNLILLQNVVESSLQNTWHILKFPLHLKRLKYSKKMEKKLGYRRDVFNNLITDLNRLIWTLEDLELSSIDLTQISIKLITLETIEGDRIICLNTKQEYNISGIKIYKNEISKRLYLLDSWIIDFLSKYLLLVPKFITINCEDLRNVNLNDLIGQLIKDLASLDFKLLDFYKLLSQFTFNTKSFISHVLDFSSKIILSSITVSLLGSDTLNISTVILSSKIVELFGSGSLNITTISLSSDTINLSSNWNESISDVLSISPIILIESICDVLSISTIILIESICDVLSIYTIFLSSNWNENISDVLSISPDIIYTYINLNEKCVKNIRNMHVFSSTYSYHFDSLKELDEILALDTKLLDNHYTIKLQIIKIFDRIDRLKQLLTLWETHFRQ